MKRGSKDEERKKAKGMTEAEKECANCPTTKAPKQRATQPINQPTRRPLTDEEAK